MAPQQIRNCSDPLVVGKVYLCFQHLSHLSCHFLKMSSRPFFESCLKPNPKNAFLELAEQEEGTRNQTLVW